MGITADYINDLNTNSIISTDIISLLGRVHVLFPSISLHQAPNMKTQENIKTGNTLIEIKYRESDLIRRINDPRRSVETPLLAGAFYNNEIFGIYRQTNASDDPYEPFIILDKTIYLNAAAYMHNFFEEDPGVDTERAAGGYIAFSGDLPEIPNKMNPVIDYPLNTIEGEAYADAALNFSVKYYIP